MQLKFQDGQSSKKYDTFLLENNQLYGFKNSEKRLVLDTQRTLKDKDLSLLQSLEKQIIGYTETQITNGIKQL